MSETGPGSIDVLIVAGGGAGGGRYYSGGGGAGGVVSSNSSITFTGSASVTVGNGGAATAENTRGNIGSDSSFGSVLFVLEVRELIRASICCAFFSTMVRSLCRKREDLLRSTSPSRNSAIYTVLKTNIFSFEFCGGVDKRLGQCASHTFGLGILNRRPVR